MSIGIVILSFIIGVICGRYFRVVKNDEQILSDMVFLEKQAEKAEKDIEMHTDFTDEFQVISPSKQRQKQQFENDLKDDFEKETPQNSKKHKK